MLDSQPNNKQDLRNQYTSYLMFYKGNTVMFLKSSDLSSWTLETQDAVP